MSATILDGKALAQTMQAEIAARVAEFTRSHGFKPGLAAVLLTLTGIASIVPLVLLWVFAFMRWPRDQASDLLVTAGTPGPPVRPAPRVLAARGGR